MPFITEEIYKNLTGFKSVHLSSWPKSRSALIDPKLEEQMKDTRKIVESCLSLRKSAAIKVRQPLNSLSYSQSSQLPAELEDLLASEVNVKKVIYQKGDFAVSLDTDLDHQLLAEGQAREAIRSVQELRKTKGALLDQQIRLTLPNPPADPALLDLIKKQTLASQILPGPELAIELI